MEKKTKLFKGDVIKTILDGQKWYGELIENEEEGEKVYVWIYNSEETNYLLDRSEIKSVKYE